MKANDRRVTEPLSQDQIDHGADGMPELHVSAELPGAPEAPGPVADLQRWDEPVDERGHRVGFSDGESPTIAEYLVQQGANEADDEIRGLGDRT